MKRLTGTNIMSAGCVREGEERFILVVCSHSREPPFFVFCCGFGIMGGD